MADLPNTMVDLPNAMVDLPNTMTDGIELVLLNHTYTRGPSVTRMRDFLNLHDYFDNFLTLECNLDHITEDLCNTIKG